MKIATIDAFQVRWGAGDTPYHHCGFVRVRTDDGLDGLGEVFPMQGGLEPLGIIARRIAPARLGADPLDHAVRGNRLIRHAAMPALNGPPGRSGLQVWGCGFLDWPRPGGPGSGHAGLSLRR